MSSANKPAPALFSNAASLRMPPPIVHRRPPAVAETRPRSSSNSSRVSNSSRNSMASRPAGASPMPQGAAAQSDQKGAARLAAWAPAGGFKTGCCGAVSVCMIQGAGTTQSSGFVCMLWERYQATGERCLDIATAFAEAMGQCVRTGQKQIGQMLREVIAYFEDFTEESYQKLVYVASELSERACAVELLSKSKGQRRVPAFYLGIIRMATETLKVVDMDLAVSVCEEMEKVGVPHTAISFRLMSLGNCRLPVPCVQSGLAMVKFALTFEEALPSCSLGQFVALCETAVGPDAGEAADFLNKYDKNELHNVYAAIMPQPADTNCAGCFSASCTKYFLLDVATVDITESFVIPPESYIIVLSTTVRFLKDRMSALCSTHKMYQKGLALRRLLEKNDRCIVVPLQMELCMRRDMPVGSVANPKTAAEHIDIFMKVSPPPTTCTGDPFKLHLVSAAVKLKAAAAALGDEHRPCTATCGARATCGVPAAVQPTGLTQPSLTVAPPPTLYRRPPPTSCYGDANPPTFPAPPTVTTR